MRRVPHPSAHFALGWEEHAHQPNRGPCTRPVTMGIVSE